MKTGLRMLSCYSDELKSSLERVYLAKERMGKGGVELRYHGAFTGIDLFLEACSCYGLKGVVADEMNFNSELKDYSP